MGVIAPPEPGEVDAVYHREAPWSERPFFTVDLVIFTVRAEQLQVLLVERAELFREGGWALPGGWLDLQRDDSIETCALRKLVEEAGVHAPYLEQLKTYGSRDRDPRGWTITTVYFALMASERERLGSAGGGVLDAGARRWRGFRAGVRSRPHSGRRGRAVAFQVGVHAHRCPSAAG